MAFHNVRVPWWAWLGWRSLGCCGAEHASKQACTHARSPARRQGVVGAASVHHLCKSIVMVNTRAPPHSELLAARPAGSAIALGARNLQQPNSPACPTQAHGPPISSAAPFLHRGKPAKPGHVPAALPCRRPPTCPAVVDCSDPNNSKYYLVVVQARQRLGGSPPVSHATATYLSCTLSDARRGLLRACRGCGTAFAASARRPTPHPTPGPPPPLHAHAVRSTPHA